MLLQGRLARGIAANTINPLPIKKRTTAIKAVVLVLVDLQKQHILYAVEYFEKNLEKNFTIQKIIHIFAADTIFISINKV